MPLNIELPGFTLESVDSKDNYLTHYSALGEKNVPYTVTEFFPSYMASRSETGGLLVVPRFANEFEIALSKFKRTAQAMMDLNDPSVTPIENIIEANETAYVVRRVSELPTLDTYMSGKRMDFGEAFLFIRPLFIFLTQSQSMGDGIELMFKFTHINLRINRYGMLVLDSMFYWDITYQATIMDISKLYFQLITGSVFDPSTPDPQAFGVTPPPKLDAMLKEVLTDDILYGSIDDYFKKFKSVVDTDTGGPSDDEKGSGLSGNIMKWAAIGLAVVFIGALLVLLNLVVLPAYRHMFPGLANPHMAHAPAAVQPAGEEEEEEERRPDFFAVAYTNPRDGSDVLNGMFAAYENTFYYRGYNNGPCLIKRSPDGAEHILVHNVRPSFINATGDFVYFSDGLSGNKIYRVTTNGDQLEMLSRHAALYLHLDGNFLYYTNHDDFNRLYRINLRTMEDSLFIPVSALETVILNGTLYFINGSHGFNLFSVDVNAANADWTRLNSENSNNLRLFNRLLFFLVGDEIRITNLSGQPVMFDCPVKAYAFHPAGDWLVIIEAETYALFAYNPETREKVEISTSTASAYVWAYDGRIHVSDYYDSRFKREFPLPGD
jgi:hypothetical protein